MHHHQQKHETNNFVLEEHYRQQHRIDQSIANSWIKDKKILYSNNNNNNHIASSKSGKRTSSQHKREAILQQNVSPNNHKTTSNDSNIYNKIANSTDLVAPSTSSNSNTNTTVIGHYELKRTLGKGNFSTVKLAQHRITHHLVAIKIVKTSILSEDNLMKINREIEVLKKIAKHNNIVRLYQVIKTKRYFMLVTENCPNGELYDYLVERGRLNEPQSCNYFLQILSALEYLHDHNIVHRDLKAENLLLSNDYKTIKIADFGFANYYKQNKLLSTWCGSPPYAAPELFRGLHYVGPPVDIWSLGVILYVLVCGSLPFDGHNLVFLKSRVLSGKFRIPFFMSTECEGLIRGMLRLDPERRFNIRQIRSHGWTMKHSNGLSKKDAIINEVNKMSIAYTNSALIKTSGSSCANSKELPNTATNMTISKSPIINDIRQDAATSVQSLDKNNNNTNNRGQSLDLEDDKKKITTNTNNDDASMLCLTNSNEGKLSTNQKCSSAKSSKIQNFVDTDMANAVSNMSLDSNNSSMSASQSIDIGCCSYHSNSTGGSTRLSSSRVDSLPSAMRNLSKENSLDDQIIDFMVDNLKVAESQSPIRQSIANDKYDDLHAIYRLIKDDPKIIIDAQVKNKFKIPSLPLISYTKQMSAKKPSITTGFFNPPNNFTNLSNDSKDSFNSIDCKVTTSVKENRNFQHPSNDGNNEESYKNGPIDLVTNSSNYDNNYSNKMSCEKQRGSDDQTWKIPPQLFLTPPAETRPQTTNQKQTFIVPSTQESDFIEDNSPKSIEVSKNDYPQFPNLARHSFDSTIQQTSDPSTSIPGFSNNKLMLTSCAKQSLWDSSILDSLGVSTPSKQNQSVNILNAAIDNNYLTQQGNSVNYCNSGNNVQIAQNLAQITTNLPQIGQLSNNTNTINQNLLLSHLNSLALSAAVTQSSVLTQAYKEEVQSTCPIKFTPNNLMNQNCTNINNLTLQNNLTSMCPTNLSLLDPNGLMSGLERRASDGQASYSSLTTNGPNLDNQNYPTNPLDLTKTAEATDDKYSDETGRAQNLKIEDMITD